MSTRTMITGFYAFPHFVPFSVLDTHMYNQGFTLVSPPNFMFLYPVQVKGIVSSFCAYGGGPSFPCQSLAASHISKGPASTMVSKLKTEMKYTFYCQFTFRISLAVSKTFKTVCSYQTGLVMCRTPDLTYHSCFAVHAILNVKCHSCYALCTVHNLISCSFYTVYIS